VSFETGSPGENGDVIVDNREIFTLPLPYTDQGLLQFPEIFVTALKTALSLPPVEEPSLLRIAAIVIDPGHGGKDSGAVGNHIINGNSVKLMEKDVTLKVSTLLRSRLSAAYPGKQILMTRTGDTYPTLEDRVKFAHAIPLRDDEAIIFISIHANASFNKAARGYEVWYLSPEYRRTVIATDKEGSADINSIRNAMMEEEFTTESIIMAQSIMKGLEEYLGPRIPARGIKAEEWFVVRNARMPSVLVELGFVTNAEDSALFLSETHLRSFSDALYKGISEFITLFERSGGFTSN
jgi:N-acetylmuramoyl-L-alanine amidase